MKRAQTLINWLGAFEFEAKGLWKFVVYSLTANYYMSISWKPEGL